MKPYNTLNEWKTEGFLSRDEETNSWSAKLARSYMCSSLHHYKQEQLVVPESVDIWVTVARNNSRLASPAADAVKNRPVCGDPTLV